MPLAEEVQCQFEVKNKATCDGAWNHLAKRVFDCRLLFVCLYIRALFISCYVTQFGHKQQMDIENGPY